MSDAPAIPRPRLARGVRLQEDKARGRFALLAPERVLEANSTAVEVLRLCDGTRTLSVHFYQLAREGISADHAYASAAILVLAISVINLGSSLAMGRYMRRYA